MAGVIGFLTKIRLDIRIKHQSRKSVAAALAGELGAYLRLLQPEQTVEHIKARLLQRFLAKSDSSSCAARSLFQLAIPVFDRVADKIGGLPPEAARGISEAYNIMTAGRLLLTSMSSDSFLQSPDEAQVARIIVMADRFGQEIEGMQRIIALLERLSHQSFRCYLMACDCGG